MATAARKRRNEWPSLDAAFASYASKPPLNVMRADALRAYVEYGLRDRGDGAYVLKCRPEVEARIYSMGPTHGAYERLAGVHVPVRVVCGEASTDISPAFGTRIAELIQLKKLPLLARVMETRARASGAALGARAQRGDAG